MQTAASVTDRFETWARAEHQLYQWRDGNRLWLSLADVVRYRRFVDLVLSRIDQDREALDSATAASVQGLRNYAGGPISPKQRLLDHQAESAQAPLHLDIESLYLFAKVVLDRVAWSVEVYFGQAQKCSLASHDSFRKCLATYAAATGLSLPTGFAEQMDALQHDVDFRDKQLVHLKGGATRGTSWNMDTRSAQIMILPDKPSRDPRDLVRAVDDYLEMVMLLFEGNRGQAHLLPK